jgi:lysozyme
MKKINTIIIVTVLISVICYFYFSAQQNTISDYSSNKYIKGIDISHHQNVINWSEINTSEIKFVIIKSTEGSDWVDPRFKFNWKESHKRNLFIGAFHRFSLLSNGINQAKNFISTVPKLENSIPPAIDIQNLINANLDEDSDAFKELVVLENELFEYYGKKPIFYSSEYHYNKYIKDNFINNKVWIYDHGNNAPSLFKNISGIWQFSINGKVLGIKGNVDVDYFNGTLESFIKFIK